MKARHQIITLATAVVFNFISLMGAELKSPSGFLAVESFGFSPDASGVENAKALQSALDQAGTITVSRPGIYKLASTVYLGSDTSLIFGNGVILRKVDEKGPFTHVMLNKGALTKICDHNIRIEGLQIEVNGVDKSMTEVYGLRGQLAFFHVKDLRIDRFRCFDLAKGQFCIHICTFEDILLNDVMIKGDKDGIHLGRGKRFTIQNCVFQTYDDAIALNAHDYATSNPELGWIEDGVVQNCYDLQDNQSVGYFCRMLAGAWIDWKSGMEVQQSDTVVSNGKLYRVQAKPDGTIYKSITQPTHEKGSKVLDGINWGVIQGDVVYTAGVRNVIFRDIFLEKARVGFSIHFDNDRYNRSFYPGAAVPMQEQIILDNVRVLHNQPKELFSIDAPIDTLTITHSSIRDNPISFRGNQALAAYPKTQISLLGCVFNKHGTMDLVCNSAAGKEIRLKTAGNLEYYEDFRATVNPGNGKIIVDSDLSGLKKP